MTNEEITNIAIDSYKQGYANAIKLISEFLNDIIKHQDENFKQLLSNINNKVKQ